MGQQPGQKCTYCGSLTVLGEAACVACGARAVSVPDTPVISVPEPKAQNVYIGAGVWLFLGLFGGYAYWSGNPVRACARVALWIALVGAMALGGSVDRAAGVPTPPFAIFLFASSGLMIFILWVFDLVHLLRRWGQPAHIL